ncbi:MAG: NAD(P)/FAD-dependent oxidoreductase [Tepidisphaeraceae bacterium]
MTSTTKTLTRVLILGGGFGGVYTALRLQRSIGKRDRSVEVTLLSRDNYFLMTPLLFEAASGVLEPRHAVNPIRPLLKRCRFVEGEIDRVDFDRRIVIARHASGFAPFELPFDHLVLALGGVTNRAIIPGSELAMTFKTLGDGIFLRNHVIDLFERAEIEPDVATRRKLLTFVVIGAGLVGVELVGELTEFVPTLARSYPRVGADEISFHLIEAGPNVLPEMERDLADHATNTLKRRGVHVRTAAPVQRIEPDVVVLPSDERIEAATIVLAAGVAPNALLKDMPLEKGKGGRLVVDATMRVQDRPGVWALGDCAAIPDSQGKPYPTLAQHAMRQAKVLARNILASIRAPDGPKAPLEPFVYQSLGTLAALGHYDGVGRVMRIKLRGFLAWWVWRSYYLMQMPRFDRRLRIVLDWTIALLFKNDVVKLDLFGDEHPLRKRT